MLRGGRASDGAQPFEVRGDRSFVAHDGNVGRTLDALGVEHGTVDGEVAVARELLTGCDAPVGFVVGDDGGQGDDDPRLRPSRVAGCRAQERHDLVFQRDWTRAPRDGAVGNATGEREHARLQRGEQQRRCGGAGTCSCAWAEMVSPSTSAVPSCSNGTRASRYSRMWRAGRSYDKP